MSKFDDIRSALGLTDGRLEAVGQGAFGMGDELGAGLQGALAKATGTGDYGSTYRQALFENKDRLDKQRAAEPYLTPAIEALSGAAFTAPLAPLAVGAKGVLGAMKAAAPVGAAFGYGGSNAESLPGQALDAAKGGAMAALGAGALKGGAGVFRRLAQAKLAAQVEAANAAGLAARPAELARPDLQALRAQAVPRPPGVGDRISGLAEGYMQQEADKVANRGATWVDQATGFKHGPMSGLPNDDIMWPGTDNVRIPAATNQEKDLFQRLMARDAAGPAGATAPATRNLRAPNLEPTAQPVTKPADRETMIRAFLRDPDKEE